MNILSAHLGESAIGLALLAALTALALWLVFKRRPTPDEIERARRLFLSQSGRLVDGMLLDIYDIDSPPTSKNEPARTLTMLLYSYHIGGVDYECSQDITGMPGVVDPAQVRAGFPCSARYQPGNPQNSIVVSEEWSGLRMACPPSTFATTPTPST